MQLLRLTLVLPLVMLATAGGAALAAEPAKAGGAGDLSEYRPLELLKLLQKNADAWLIFSVHDRQKGWVREEDIPQLISLLDSKEPCTPVNLMVSSYLPPKSTIGAQAAFMIQGFRLGFYPPAMSASAITEEDKNEMKQWWRKRQATPVKK